MRISDWSSDVCSSDLATKDPSTRLLDMKRLPFSPVRSGYDGRRGKIRYRGWRILSARPSYSIGRCVIARGSGGECHAERHPADRVHAIGDGPAPLQDRKSVV